MFNIKYADDGINWDDPNLISAIKDIKRGKADKVIGDYKKDKREPERKNNYDPDFIGFILLHCKIIYSSVFDDAFILKIFIYCLARANHKDKEIIINNQAIQLKRGQFITSIDKIAKACKISPRKIRTRTKTLILTRRLTIKTTNRYSLITVLNYDKYQLKRQAERQADGKTDVKQRSTEYNNNNNNKLKENIKRKKNVNFDDLPEFWKCKIKSLSNFERILAYFYVFSGYNFKDKWELMEQIKGDKGYYERDLQIIAKHADPVILQVMANLSEKGSFKLNECAVRLSAKQGKQRGKIDGVKADLADKMAM